MAATGFSRGSAPASEIRVYIQDDDHDKENIEDQDNIAKISSEENVNWQELEETPQKRSVPLNDHRKKGNAARWSNDLNSSSVPLVPKNSYFLQLCLTLRQFSVYIFTQSLELAALVILLAQLPVNYRQLSRTSLAV